MSKDTKERFALILSGKSSLTSGVSGLSSMLPPTTLDTEDERPITVIDNFPAVIFKEVEKIFSWPKVSLQFSQESRSELQEKKLLTLKKYKKVDKIFHSILDLMPGHLIDQTFSQILGMKKDSSKRTEYLLDYVFQYTGIEGASGNRRYLMSGKTKKYLKKAKEKFYNDERNKFIGIDEKSKVGVLPAEDFLIFVIVAVEALGHKALNDVLLEMGMMVLYDQNVSLSIDHEDALSKIKEDKIRVDNNQPEKYPRVKTTEELVILRNALDIDEFTHIEHGRFITDRELYEVIKKLNAYLINASRTASANGFDFAPVLSRNERRKDSVSWSRTMTLKMKKAYEERGRFTPRQKSYTLSLVSSVQEAISKFENPEVLALIKTKVGILQFSQDGEGKVQTEVIGFDDKSSEEVLKQLEAPSEYRVDVSTDVDSIWDLSWLDNEIDLSDSKIHNVLNDKQIKMFWRPDLLEELFQFLLEIEIIFLKYEKYVDPEQMKMAKQYFSNFKMKREFVVKTSMVNKFIEVMQIFIAYATLLNISHVQKEIQPIHDACFGGMFDVFKFLEKFS